MEYLSELLKISEINEILKQYLTEIGENIDHATFDSYSIERLREGVGYLGQHHHLTIKYKRQGITKLQEISFFVKVATEHQQKYLEEIFVFHKETNLYRDVLSRLKATTVIPKYYQTSSKNVIVLENLENEDFKLFDNSESILDLEHLMIALKSLATLHAASVNFEYESGKSLMGAFPEYLIENSYKNDPNGLRKYRLENAIKVFQNCIPEIELLKDHPNTRQLVDIWPDIMRQIYEFCKPSEQYRNMFLHGDLWKNNLLFAYKDNDITKPIGCKFVDFQFSRYAPAAFDVMTLIVLTTYRTFRDEHIENLLNFYYANFLSQITHKNIPIESYEVFRESCNDFHLAALIEKSMFTHYPPELPEQLTSHLNIDYSGDNYITNFPFELARIAYQHDEKYRKRFDDVVIDVMDNFITFD